jgi:hypothetical protein
MRILHGLARFDRGDTIEILAVKHRSEAYRYQDLKYYAYNARYEMQPFTASDVADAATNFAKVKSHIAAIVSRTEPRSYCPPQPEVVLFFSPGGYRVGAFPAARASNRRSSS